MAQSSIANYPAGTCKQIKDGYWQQMPDGTWAAPGDNLNTCGQNLNIWNINQNNLYNQNNFYNPQLANMDNGQWLLMCVLLSSILPQSRCQGYNPAVGNLNNYGLGGFNSLLQYPSVGRNYIAFGGNNYSVSVGTDDSKDFWKTALIGVGMGWLLNRLTS